MSLAIPAEVRNSAPEFEALTDPQIQDFLDMANDEINEDAWGSRAKRAEILLACHKMATLRIAAPASGASPTVGPIQSTKVGDVSVTYAAAASQGATTIAVQVQGLDSSLAGSPYGLEYARLQKLAAMGGEVLDGN